MKPSLENSLSPSPMGSGGARTKTATVLFFILFSGSSLMKTYSQGLVQANGNDIAYTMRRFGVQTNNPILPFEVNGSGKFYKNLLVDSLITSWHIQTQQIEAGTATITGDLTANKLTVTSTVLFNSLSGSGNGLVGVDASGELKRYNMTGNVNDYFRGDGTFGNLSSVTGWQWYGTDLVSNAQRVVIQRDLAVVGHISVGVTKIISNGSTIDTMRTSKELQIISDAELISMRADTVRMKDVLEAPRMRTPQLTVSGDASVSGTVNSSEVNATTITSNDLAVNTQFSSPKIVTSRITSPDSVIQIGDSSIYIGYSQNYIATDKKNQVVNGGTLYLQPQNPSAVPSTWQGNNTVINPYMGKVGIGTTTPSEKLEVAGNIRINDNDILFVSQYPDGNHGIGWYGVFGALNKPFAGDIVQGPVLYGYNGGALGINQFGTKSISLRWTGDGKVGINRNTFLFAQLHVQAVANTTGLYVSTDHGTNYGYGLLSSVSGDATKAFAAENRATGQEVFEVWGDGRVYATDLTIKPVPFFPDYVFSENYKRPSWMQKKKYYKKYNHLMYVDNAADIYKNGFTISKNLTGLTRNVEEISLDVVDLYEIVISQQAEINELKREVRELKKKQRGK